MKVQSGKTYIGVVEDNNDPNKLGKVKVRVLGIYDNTPLEDIPWANPWKDLSGDSFSIPDKGKVVTVVFENDNINNPEFIFSDHYNVNLEKKISELNDSDYLSTKSLIFDHKTQVYVNDSEGLKLDHKFNLINIRENSIDIGLKDNFGKINLGTANSTQRIILGDNFLNWFDDFVKILMGDKGGPFLGNLGAPVIATPALLGSLQLYQQLKDPKFLSKNVYSVDNDNVSKLDRIAEGQIGDTWVSTVKENEITSKEPVGFKPTDGSTDTTFDQPLVNSPLSTQSVSNSSIPKPNPDVEIIKEILKMKNYNLYEDIMKLNIIGVRNQCQSIGDKYTDNFIDRLYLMFKKEDGTWELKQYMISTVPGLEFTITDSWLSEKNLTNVAPWIGSSGKKISMKEYAKISGGVNGDPNLKNGLPILVPSQYIDIYYLSQYKGAKAFLTISGASQLVWRDKDSDNPDTFNPYNYSNPELITPNSLNDNGIKIHLGYPGGQKVGNWSEGSQVFSNADSLNEFFKYCDKHIEKYDNKFTYTLVTKNDWDQAVVNIDANKSGNSLTPTQIENITINTSTGSTSSIQSSTQSIGNVGNPTEFIISILNPTSDVSRKVSGAINMNKQGTQYIATGIISGFPDGGVIGPISSQPSIGGYEIVDSMVSQMIRVLEDSIISKYQTQVKLVVVDKK